MKPFLVLAALSIATLGLIPISPGGYPVTTSMIAAADAEKDCTPEAGVPQHLQDISVTIRASSSEGSGVAFVRGDQTFVWTAAHVIDDLRSTRQVVDAKTGSKRTVIEFKDAKVVKTLIEDGRTVGVLEMSAAVIRYSDADHGEDLALLRVRKRGFIKSSVEFYLDKPIPPLGTRLYHVGSLLGGRLGSNSMTSGIMSQHGRLIGKTVFDQTTCPAFPGSSGGGVYKTDGRLIGMLVRGAGESFNLIVPVRRMRTWAKRAKIEWAMDRKVKMPSDEELRRLPIDDSGVEFPSDDVPKGKRFPYLIQLKDDGKK